MFAGKARRLPYCGAPFVGSCPTHKHYTILETLAKDRHSSLLQKFVTYGRKKFYKIGSSRQKFFDEIEMLSFVSSLSRNELILETVCKLVRSS
jgi:hypothetical protein